MSRILATSDFDVWNSTLDGRLVSLDLDVREWKDIENCAHVKERSEELDEFTAEATALKCRGYPEVLIPQDIYMDGILRLRACMKVRINATASSQRILTLRTRWGSCLGRISDIYSKGFTSAIDGRVRDRKTYGDVQQWLQNA